MKSFFPWLLFVCLVGIFACAAIAQDSSSSWSTSQLSDPNGSLNPTRTTQSHSERDGHVVDQTSLENVGPDGRYVPYSDTEKESVQVDANTTRTVERTFGRGPDGQRMLIQQSETESRKLANGESRSVRTTSSPDADGRLQTTRREETDSKQLSPDVRQTNTTVFSPDGNGGLSPSVRIEEREKKTEGGGVDFSQSTQLSDGTGHWNLSERREGTVTREPGRGGSKEERVFRPDASGHLAEVERTVTRDSGSAGEKDATTETYSTNIPGVAGNDQLQLVSREITVQKTGSNAQSTIRQVENINPGNPSSGLQLTKQAIDIVRPGGSGTAQQQSTTLTFDSEGHTNSVVVQMGTTNNPSAVEVDTRSTTKSK